VYKHLGVRFTSFPQALIKKKYGRWLAGWLATHAKPGWVRMEGALVDKKYATFGAALFSAPKV